MTNEAADLFSKLMFLGFLDEKLNLKEEKDMFIIDYGTGITEVVDGDLDSAKEAAEAGMNYTQQNVRILDEEENEVAVSRWYGVEPAEDEIVIAQFGSFGYYADWEEIYV